MGIRTWAYDPEKCDNDYCPGNCYVCTKAEITADHFPVEVAIAMLKGEDDEISGTQKAVYRV